MPLNPTNQATNSTIIVLYIQYYNSIEEKEFYFE